MLSFAQETEEDIAAIRELVTVAFDRKSEAELIEAIRNSPNFIPQLSIVAKENGHVVGHILFSPIVIEAQTKTFPALALAPLAVTPIRQRQGIGSQLVKVGLSKCRELNHCIIVVLGDPQYYQRFGFQTASKFAIQAPFSVSDEVFMVREIQPSALRDIKGIVRYPQYFEEV